MWHRILVYCSDKILKTHGKPCIQKIQILALSIAAVFQIHVLNALIEEEEIEQLLIGWSSKALGGKGAAPMQCCSLPPWEAQQAHRNTGSGPSRAHRAFHLPVLLVIVFLVIVSFRKKTLETSTGKLHFLFALPAL